MTEWIEVLKAVTSVPTLSLRGTIREVHAESELAISFMGNGKPLWAAVGDGHRVWRDGARLRVESDDGTVRFISDGVTAWDFSNDPTRPLVGTPRQVHYFGDVQFLLGTRDAADWAGNDFTQPTGPPEEVEFAGRRCWTIQLAPPAHKPHPLRIWVDIESGQILGQRSEEFGQGLEFTDLVVGEEFDGALFTWVGPTMTPAQHQDIMQAQRLALERQQSAWFAENVTATPPRARVLVDFTPTSVHAKPSDAGGFLARNDHTVLARRPRTGEDWEPNWAPPGAYVWSTPEWDWAADVDSGDLDVVSIRELQESLHPGEPVDRQRRIRPGREA